MDHRILIAEDSAIQAALLRRLLSAAGYQVWVARDGKEALELLQKAPISFSLVLSDVDMPEVDGYELCRAIKADARLQTIPVILLTNLSDPHNVIWGLQAGADNYLTKPVEAELLLARVASLLASPALYQDGGADSALTFSLAGERFAITSSRGQILNLLLSTFEGAVWQNQKLRASNDELSLAHRELSSAHRDVAEKNQELKKLMEQQNSFLGMVTHDMRNPLGVILGYSRLLADGMGGTLTARQQKFCSAIHRSTDALLALVNDLLEISEIESGNLRLNLVSTDLPALVRQAVELNGFLAEPKGIRVEADLDSLQEVSVDPGKIEQVINNLLTNAVKFSHKNSTVRVELRHEGDQVRLSVLDHGQGIPTAEQANLFQPFHKTSAKPTDGEKSTGLGLAIVKRIVEGHGGTISVESEPNRGTAFHVRLPLTPHTLEPSSPTLTTTLKKGAHASNL
jgi:two-component system sensor histidine kinase/response regulator